METKQNTVRLLTTPADFNVLDLPVLFKGSLQACKLYCEMWAGMEWRADSSIFGGYYANVSNGDCFLLT